MLKETKKGERIVDPHGVPKELRGGGWSLLDELVYEAWILSGHPREVLVSLWLVYTSTTFQRIVQQSGKVLTGWNVTGVGRRSIRLSGVCIVTKGGTQTRTITRTQEWGKCQRGHPEKVKTRVFPIKPLNKPCWTCGKCTIFLPNAPCKGVDTGKHCLSKEVKTQMFFP